MSLTAKYTGNDFLEWYKELYGKEYDGSNFTRLDGMSDHDWGIGQGLLKSYNKGKQLDDWKKSQEDELLRNYTVGVDSLANDREKALRNSYIAYEKLKKYLPMQLKAQGLGGLGVSEVSARQMNNDYLNNRGAIESSYLQKKGDLLENYNASRFNLEQDYKLDKDAWANENNGLGESIFQGYMKEHKADQDAKMEEYGNLYFTPEAMSTLIETFDGKISKAKYEERSKLLESIRNEIGEDNYTTLKNILEQSKSLVRTDEDERLFKENEVLKAWKTAGAPGQTKIAHPEFNGQQAEGLPAGMIASVRIKDGDEGMSLSEFERRADISGNKGLNEGEAGWMGSEKDYSKAIAKQARNGTLADGTIFDINVGGGTNWWVYLNGKFYRIEY